MSSSSSLSPSTTTATVAAAHSHRRHTPSPSANASPAATDPPPPPTPSVTAFHQHSPPPAPAPPFSAMLDDRTVTMHTQDWASSPSVSTAAAASASSSGNSAFTPQLPAPNRIADPNEPSYDQYYRTFGDTEADRQAHEFDDGPLDLHNGHAGRGGTGGGSASDHSDSDDDEHHRVVNTDPTGRFQCWDICLGKGAFKEVYKAFDVEEGIEVAWNQLRTDIISRKDITKVASEVRLLKQLRHDNIINFTDVWTARGPDGRERVYFITELMSSGTLKSFIRKAKGKLKLKVVKNLCRHILRGLAYLHSRTPPIIHRDLKCDNIFINGNNGVAKIGDLGLATIKNKDHISSVVGTPEFLAPELYEERYDERVDIYAFGMCVLELVTKEYPYQECANQAQIWKRVSAGIKPQALAKVADPETRQFIELCIAHDYHQRPSAQQLLDHPFLAPDPPGTPAAPQHQNLGSPQMNHPQQVAASPPPPPPPVRDRPPKPPTTSYNDYHPPTVPAVATGARQAPRPHASGQQGPYPQLQQPEPGHPSNAAAMAASAAHRPPAPPATTSSAPPAHSPRTSHATTHHHAHAPTTGPGAGLWVDPTARAPNPPPLSPTRSLRDTFHPHFNQLGYHDAAGDLDVPPSTPEGTFRTTPTTDSNRAPFQLTMQVIGLNLSQFTLTVNMTMVTGPCMQSPDQQTREVKFPFHLVEDTVEDIVGEMLREGVVELTPSERADVAHMMRAVVYGDEVSEMVLARADEVAREQLARMDAVEMGVEHAAAVHGVDAGEVDGEVMDPRVFEAWVETMQREWRLLDMYDEAHPHPHRYVDHGSGDEDEDDDGEGGGGGWVSSGLGEGENEEDEDAFDPPAWVIRRESETSATGVGAGGSGSDAGSVASAQYNGSAWVGDRTQYDDYYSAVAEERQRVNREREEEVERARLEDGRLPSPPASRSPPVTVPAPDHASSVGSSRDYVNEDEEHQPSGFATLTRHRENDSTEDDVDTANRHRIGRSRSLTETASHGSSASGSVSSLTPAVTNNTSLSSANSSISTIAPAGGPACHGEGAYVSQFRRPATGSSTSLASQVSVPSSVGTVPGSAPVAPSGYASLPRSSPPVTPPVRPQSSSNNPHAEAGLMRTLSELQSLALSGFTEEAMGRSPPNVALPTSAAGALAASSGPGSAAIGSPRPMSVRDLVAGQPQQAPVGFVPPPPQGQGQQQQQQQQQQHPLVHGQVLQRVPSGSGIPRNLSGGGLPRPPSAGGGMGRSAT